MISTRRRRQVITDRLGDFQSLPVDRRKSRIRVTHHIAIHVTTSCDGVHRGVIDLLDRLLQILFDNPMQLIRLTSCQLEIFVSKIARHPIHFKPLAGRRNSAWNPDTDHKAKGLLKSGTLPLDADIPVILLVGSVEFEQLLVILGDGSRGVICQTLGDGSPKVITGSLDGLVL